jgi:hypothetical protein
MIQPERMWVHPNFKKTIKKEAAELGVSIFKLTEDIGNDNEDIFERLRKKDDTKLWKKFDIKVR